MTERTGELTFKGGPLTLLGKKLSAGDTAPNFKLTGNDLSPVTLDDSAGKVRIISVVPSLDTGVCDKQTRRFNEEAAGLGDHIAILTVSADLPFAQARWCGAAGIDKLQTASDHYDMNFADAYGTHIKELRLDTRAIFVVDSAGKLVHVQYVPEMTDLPDFDSAIAAAKSVS